MMASTDGEDGPIARLRRIAEGSGIMMVDVADRSGMSLPILWRLLLGRTEPSFPQVSRVLEAVGATWRDLDPPDRQVREPIKQTRSVKPGEEYIGVDEVATEMKYTPKQAWEFLRSIGVLALNCNRIGMARFTRVEFDEARERAKAPIAPRQRKTQPAVIPESSDVRKVFPTSEEVAARYKAATKRGLGRDAPPESK